jgi:hypothetical protein
MKNAWVPIKAFNVHVCVVVKHIFSKYTWFESRRGRYIGTAAVNII